MATCAGCGAEIAIGSEVLVQGKNRRDPAITLCQGCSAKVENEFQAETEGANLVGAAFVGALAAIAAGLVWFGVVVATKYEVGFLALGLGWLVAFAVVWGSGKKRGALLQILSAGITLVTMVASEYFILRYIALQGLIQEGYDVSRVPLFLPISDIINVMVEYLKAEPTTLLFWALAVWQAFVIPAGRKLKRVG
jgi:hypothetical protein